MKTTVAIQAFSYTERQEVLPALAEALTRCGGWVLDRRVLSPAALEMEIEIELRSVVDLYASILATGVELTRSGHAALTDLCLSRQHMALAAALGQTVAIRLDVSFLSDLPVTAMLARSPVA